MGQRGPKPTPTKVLALRGSWLAKTRPSEPQPAPALPSCPTWLDPKSAHLFRTLAKQLADLGIVAQIDRGTLARYCRLTTRWREMEAFIQEHGTTCELYGMDKEGQTFLAQLKLYPQVRVAQALAAELLRIENHFGLTPSARTALQVEKAPHEGHDPKAKFFRQA
jgi:P27 family predicted phage terminase small subunit